MLLNSDGLWVVLWIVVSLDRQKISAITMAKDKLETPVAILLDSMHSCMSMR